MSDTKTPVPDAAFDGTIRPRRKAFRGAQVVPTQPPPQRPVQPPPLQAPNARTYGVAVPGRGLGGGLDRKGAARQPTPEKAMWGVRLAKALNLPIPSSQRRVADEAITTADQIAASPTHSAQDKADAVAHGMTLVRAGEPPWNAETAMQATAAKVQLDLLSIPTTDRRLVPNGDQSVNKTFWVENAADDGTKSKSFLCKPAAKPGAVMPGGGPAGGEVMREAVAGRAAQFFLTQGIDVGMPETHVVKLRPELIGGTAGTGDVTCSVQQFGKSVGPLGGQTRADRAKLDGKKVAALAVFDAMTLNNDRHAGNVLIGTDGALIPIDHGENFSEVTNPQAAARLAVTMAGTANGLLAIPSAHDPMPPEIAKSVGAFDPNAFAATLRDDRDAIAGQHADMDGLLSDGAIKSAARAADFTKRAARMKPPLSVAAIQVALGTHVAELVDPALEYRVFAANAARILAGVVNQQSTIKEVCLTSDTDYEMLCQDVEKLGWKALRRGETTDENFVGDPLSMIAILSGNLQRPGKLVYPTALQVPTGTAIRDLPDDIKLARKNFRLAFEAQAAAAEATLATARDKVGAGDAAPVLIAARKKATDFLLTIIPAQGFAAMQARKILLDAQPQSAATVQGYGDLSNELTDMALAEQMRRFTAVEQSHQLDELFEWSEFNMVIPASYMDSYKNINAGNAVKAENELTQFEASDFSAKRMIGEFWKNFDRFAKQANIAADDADLVAFLAALTKLDPATALLHYRVLRTRFG